MATNNGNNNTSFGLTINTTNFAVTFAQNGVYENGNQPTFNANIAADITNVTGNGTVYTVIFDNIYWDVGGEYNSATGEWTPIPNATYIVSYAVYMRNLTALNTEGNVYFNDSMGTNNAFQTFNPFLLSVNNVFKISNSFIFRANGPAVITILFEVLGELTDNVTLASDSGQYTTFFSAVKIT